MIISIDWIKDFVKLPELAAKDFYNRFTLACAEVEQVEEKGLHLNKVKIVQITSLRKHPEADKLNLVTFETGEGAREVVCGAGNVRVGLKVPFAPVGTVLPGNFELTPKKIRGILSEGMLCSCNELDIPGSSEGLLELPDSATIGMSMAEFLRLTPDVLLHIDNKSLTHRPDLWGHYGLAREFATIFNLPLKRPWDQNWQQKMKAVIGSRTQSPLRPQVDPNSSALAYFGLSIDNVTVAPSPDWMQRRLLAVGLRPINNIVDISNYVMLEIGHPLHIFDRDLIKGDTITIKSLHAPETFLTLDGQKRELVPGDTVIADSEKILVLAGIMGGANSGVQDNTSRIFIEVANWKAAPTRRTSTRLGLRTESSQRFEKSLDSHQCEKVILRTLELVLQLCPQAKIVGNLEYSGPERVAYAPKVITCSQSQFARYLGTTITEERIISILSSLDFGVEKQSAELKVSIPSFRATKDVEIFDDLVEEIGRIIGYDSITPLAPRQDVLPVSLSTQQKMSRKIQDFLSVRLGAFEILTYPLIGEALLKNAAWPELAENLKLKNALSIDHDRLRPSLIPSLLEKLALNQKYFENFSFFELGRTYLAHPDPKTFCNERWQVGAVLFHREQSQPLALVNVAEDLLRTIGVSYQLQTPDPKFKSALIPTQWPGVHPQEQMHVRIMGKMNGIIFSLHPLLLKNLKVRGHASMLILDLTEASTAMIKEKITYRPLPKSQGAHFDLTVLADAGQSVGQVLEALKGIKLDFHQQTKVIDVYAPDQAAKSVTLRCHFIDPEQTLSGDFLQKSLQQVAQTLKQAGFPLKS